MKNWIILASALTAGSAWSQDGKVVLGRLGQTTANAPIYAAPNGAARVYYRAKPYEYICVNFSPNPNYLKVTMSNGAQGFITAPSVAMLPYQVTQPAATRGVRMLGNQTSRSGAARWSLKFVGTPYKWGGNDINSGIDCSGFVKKVYGAIGINLPRTAAEQALVGQPVQNLEDLVAGDRLYFWETKRGKIGHTGIYLGNGYFVHSSVGHRGVNTDVLTEKWQKILVAARR
jgi:cell wall-associated NlpC family hydrolase